MAVPRPPWFGFCLYKPTPYAKGTQVTHCLCHMDIAASWGWAAHQRTVTHKGSTSAFTAAASASKPLFFLFALCTFVDKPAPLRPLGSELNNIYNIIINCIYSDLFFQNSNGLSSPILVLSHRPGNLFGLLRKGPAHSFVTP